MNILQINQLSENSIFSTQKTNLMGKVIENETITSYEFIMNNINKLNEVKNDPNFKKYLFEYSDILKSLVKLELLEEMRKRIENIDTFYR